MKKSTLLLLLTFPLLSFNSDNTYILRGKILNHSNEEYIYLVKFYSDPVEVDSAKIEDGAFSFSGEINFPEMYVLSYKWDRNKGIYSFFLEPGEISVTIDEDNWVHSSTISGSKITDEYHMIHNEAKAEAVIDSLRSIRNQLLNTSNNTQRVPSETEIQLKIDSVNNELKTSCIQYAAEHHDSPVSPFLLAFYFDQIPLNTQDSILNSFNEELQQTSIYKTLQKRISLMKKYNKTYLN